MADLIDRQAAKDVIHKRLGTMDLFESRFNADIDQIPSIDPESKPLEAFLHPIDAYKGLKAKYLVFKADTGAKVDNCFIIRPDKDPAAIAALRAYAATTDNKILAEDIYNWVGKGESLRPQGHWIGEADGYADGELVYDVWYCSECNHCIDDGTDDPDLLPDFCPGCGAYMKGAGEDADS